MTTCVLRRSASMELSSAQFSIRTGAKWSPPGRKLGSAPSSPCAPLPVDTPTGCELVHASWSSPATPSLPLRLISFLFEMAFRVHGDLGCLLQLAGLWRRPIGLQQFRYRREGDTADHLLQRCNRRGSLCGWHAWRLRRYRRQEAACRLSLTTRMRRFVEGAAEASGQHGSRLMVGWCLGVEMQDGPIQCPVPALATPASVAPANALDTATPTHRLAPSFNLPKDASAAAAHSLGPGQHQVLATW